MLSALASTAAIFGVTQEPFVVLTSYVFAVLGLRALYFLLAGALGRLHLLRYGLAIVLGFVGVKMLLSAVPCDGGGMFCGHGHIELPIWLSLIVIVGVLALTTILSLKIPPPEEKPGPPPPEGPLGPEEKPSTSVRQS